jgi:dTDP-glucose 4,6-dehydratase
MPNTTLITGGSGFIGSNLVRYILDNRDEHVINLDALTYAGNPENLADVQSNPRYEFLHADICEPAKYQDAINRADSVLHLAAESHVDRSIHDPSAFLNTNIIGTQLLLDAWRKKANPGRFVYVSTDEVYGTLPLEPASLKFTEETPLAPNSPYAVSKTGGDMLARAYHHTYGLDTAITRCSNNFGPYQFPEKVIPLFVNNLIEGKPVPLYGDGRNVRDWLHVLDHAEAICAVHDKGRTGEAYNIGGNNERSNLELTEMLLHLCGRDHSFIKRVPDRLGHDLRYAIDATRIKNELGWQPTRSAWPDALEATVKWYHDNRTWCDHVRSGEYRRFYEQNYGANA